MDHVLSFLEIFCAWIFFTIGVINVFREAYGYATDSKSQHHDWMGLVRAVFGALCLTVWSLLMK